MTADSAFPPLYPILDTAFLPIPGNGRRERLAALIRELAQAGVEVLQYRNKHGSEEEVREDARWIVDLAGPEMRLILNDRVALFGETEFDGVHVGQEDLGPKEARRVIGPEAILGVSTHDEAQLRAAAGQPVDYIAIGPVFSTTTKTNPDPVVGLEGLRLARQLTDKPLVAIGGITPQNAAEVYAAGADSVAVISAIFAASSPGKIAKDFLARFR